MAFAGGGTRWAPFSRSAASWRESSSCATGRVRRSRPIPRFVAIFCHTHTPHAEARFAELGTERDPRMTAATAVRTLTAAKTINTWPVLRMHPH